LIDNLLDPTKYPDSPQSIEFKQTHISYVFISKDFVYKIKKPVNFGFLDFTTIEKRKFYCEQEIILNSRLSPHIYLKVVPVSKINNDFFYDSQDGDIVDYAVVMKRINENYLLRNLLKKGQVDDQSLKSIVSALYNFHQKFPASYDMAVKNSGVTMLKFTTDENFSQTEKYIDITISSDTFNSIKDYTNNFYLHNEQLFKQRIEQSRIKECHGDLHLEHIGLQNGQTFFLDCIEFNDRFRIIDVANEIAFLSMDLDYNDYFDFSKKFTSIYISLSEDKDINRLLNFYKVYRAYVRGKVISFLIDDPNIPDAKRADIITTASKYFKLAYLYSRG